MCVAGAAVAQEPAAEKGAGAAVAQEPAAEKGARAAVAAKPTDKGAAGAAIAGEPARGGAANTEIAPAPGTRWYGWQVLAADGAGLLVGALAFNYPFGDRVSLTDYRLSTGFYILPSGFVHLAHRQPWRAGGGVAARLFVPWLLAAVGGSTPRAPEQLAWVGMGLTTAADAASARDAVVEAGVALRWYGWQTLAADALALSALYAAASSRAPGKQVGTTAFVALYGLGASSVHWLHGQVGRGFASWSWRLLLPGVELLGSGACPSEGSCSSFHPILGLLAAAAIDALIAWDEVPAAQQATFTVLPTVSFDRGKAALGVVGSF
jgi:hypothetical protein